MGFVKINNRLLLWAGVGIAVMGTVFFSTALYFYVIQSVDSSKMASLDYEIAKPKPIIKTTPLKQESEPSANAPYSNSKSVPNSADSNLPKPKETTDNHIKKKVVAETINTKHSTSSSPQIISTPTAIITSTTTSSRDNTFPLSKDVTTHAMPTTTQAVPASPTVTAQMRKEDNNTGKKTMILLPANNSPLPNKQPIEIDLFSPVHEFSFNESDKPNNLFIPLIDLTADIEPLTITTLNESLSWETPNRIVGHIPITSTPGELKQGWYFGHYETLLTNEGNIFNDLPLIVDLLKDNQQVFVMINTNDHQFLYQAYKTEVVHEDYLKLTNSQIAEITLVTCVPKYKYDHRLLVTASLIGIRQL